MNMPVGALWFLCISGRIGQDEPREICIHLADRSLLRYHFTSERVNISENGSLFNAQVDMLIWHPDVTL